MQRRSFLKVTLAAAGVAVAGYYGLDMVKVNAASLSSLQSVLGSTFQAPDPAQASQPIGQVVQIPHLLRRAGFGASQSDLALYTPLGFSGAVNSLLNYTSIDNSQLPPNPNILMSYSGQRTNDELHALATWWLDRMVRTNRPLEEKMTLFWSNHFATGYDKVQNGYLMFKQNDFLRRNALGSFRDILMGIVSDAAMLIWLDGNQNRKGNTNENFAREVMEVFSTGRGPYSQADVVAGSLAFTGYSIDANGNGVFNPQRHDTSIKTFLGQTGNFGPEDIINILVARPETAANLSTELFQFFAYQNPSPDTISRLSQVYFSSNYNIGAVVQAILTSPEFISQQAYLANVKSPAEFVAAALRSTGATVGNAAAATDSMKTMGQMLFDPPTVFGWPSGLNWIDTASLLNRYNFPLLVQTSKENSQSQLNPDVLFPKPQSGGAPQMSQAVVPAGIADRLATYSTPDGIDVGALANLFFPDGMPATVLQAIASSSASITDPTVKTKNAVRLIMSTPFYMVN